MIDPIQIAWAAGLFEGEGCVSKQYNKTYRYPLFRLSLVSTDRDVVVHFCTAVENTNTVGGPKWTKKSTKPAFSWQASGAEARRIINLLYPHLGNRRRTKVDELLAEVGDRQIIPRPKRAPFCTVSGCNRPHQGRGMCARHYNRWWAAQRNANKAARA